MGDGNTRPQVSPVDNTWHRGDSAYSPDGVLQWRTQFPLAASFSEPSLAADGTHYTVIGGDELYALDLQGSIQWSADLNDFVDLPDVDPTKSMVIMPTHSPLLALKSVSATNGRPLWQIEFPADDSGQAQFLSSGIEYSANGDTAYVMTFVGSTNKTYLSAVGTDKNGVYPPLVTVDPEPGSVHPSPTADSDVDAAETQSNSLVAGSLDSAALAFLAAVFSIMRLFAITRGVRSKRKT